MEKGFGEKGISKGGDEEDERVFGVILSSSRHKSVLPSGPQVATAFREEITLSCNGRNGRHDWKVRCRVQESWRTTLDRPSG